METTKNNDADTSNTLLHDHEKSSGVPKITINPPILFSKRFYIVILIFLSYLNGTIVKNNMNIAIIEMVSNKSIYEGNFTTTIPPEFDWDTKMVGLVTSIVGYGTLFSFIGAYFVPKYGGSVTYAFSMLLSGPATFLHPFCLHLSVYILLLCRFFTGVFISVYSPCISDIYARWIPKTERSTLISFTFIGFHVGVASIHPFCGYIAHTYGWSAVFYVTGASATLLGIFFLLFLKNDPSQDEHICEKERSYIVANTDTSPTQKIAHPYKKILLSAPVWALIVVNFVYGWTINTLIGCVPLFIKHITQKNTKDVGLYSAIPNLVSIFTSPVVGIVMDHITNTTKITSTLMHKIVLSMSFISQTLFLIALTMVTDFSILIILLTLVGILGPFVLLTLQLIMVDIAPNNASAIAAFTSVSFALSTTACQTVAGFMTTNQSHREWNEFFLLSAGIIFLSTIIFLVYGSSEAQPWSLVEPQKKVKIRNRV